MIDLPLQRRKFLALGGAGMSSFFTGCQALAAGGKLYEDLSMTGELQAPDENGVRLPQGFKSRIIARSGQPVLPSSHIWHSAPDGGACYSLEDGGWIYVSNSEQRFYQGGVSAVRFAADGTISDSYSILERSNQNCAGGKTPWMTWLSCEEVDRGLVYECDPLGEKQPEVRSALGRFRHEAVAVDPVHGHLYLTEDEVDGRFYRFTSENGLPDLNSGTLEVAEIVASGDTQKLVWHPLRDPYASFALTRNQVEESTPFNGGEGLALSEGIIYFTTKGDNRVWAYDTRDNEITVLYDIETSPNPILSGVDNVTITASGDVLVAEDGGDMQLVLLGLDGAVLPVMQITGQTGSEITGPAFSPDFSRLYFSSQRGPENRSENGITYEISRL